jgi:hypothetical protein
LSSLNPRDLGFGLPQIGGLECLTLVLTLFAQRHSEIAAHRPHPYALWLHDLPRSAASIGTVRVTCLAAPVSGLGRILLSTVLRFVGLWTIHMERGLLQLGNLLDPVLWIGRLWAHEEGPIHRFGGTPLPRATAQSLRRVVFFRRNVWGSRARPV